MKIEKHTISNVVLGGLDRTDYPDFCDAFVEECEVNGKPATDAQVEAINDDYDLCSELVQDHAWEQLL